MEKVIYLIGGIGDFLQGLEFLLKNKDQKIIIYTHFKGAKDFFDYFHFPNIKIEIFDNLEELADKKINLSKGEGYEKIECQRSFFFAFDLSQNLIESNLQLQSYFKNNNKIIGIHPFGSKFANEFAESRGITKKNIPSNLIYQTIKEEFNYLIFGTSKELEENGFYEKDNIKLVSFPNIINSLAAVKLCNIFIGTDSCFKNMACINGIPTFCILDSTRDDFRDKIFSEPYEINGVLNLLKRDSLTEDSYILKYFDYATQTLSNL